MSPLKSAGVREVVLHTPEAVIHALQQPHPLVHLTILVPAAP